MATYQYAGAKVVERRYSDPNVYYGRNTTAWAR